MLNIKLIRENPEKIEKRLRSKDANISIALLLSLDEEIRELKTKVESLKSDLKSR